ncbi:MAG: hypothetical protein RIK87_23450 [Fuerstiella sp.]
MQPKLFDLKDTIPPPTRTEIAKQRLNDIRTFNDLDVEFVETKTRAASSTTFNVKANESTFELTGMVGRIAHSLIHFPEDSEIKNFVREEWQNGAGFVGLPEMYRRLKDKNVRNQQIADVIGRTEGMVSKWFNDANACAISSKQRATLEAVFQKELEGLRVIQPHEKAMAGSVRAVSRFLTMVEQILSPFEDISEHNIQPCEYAAIRNLYRNRLLRVLDDSADDEEVQAALDRTHRYLFDSDLSPEYEWSLKAFRQRITKWAFSIETVAALLPAEYAQVEITTPNA